MRCRRSRWRVPTRHQVRYCPRRGLRRETSLRVYLIAREKLWNRIGGRILEHSTDSGENFKSFLQPVRLPRLKLGQVQMKRKLSSSFALRVAVNPPSDIRKDAAPPPTNITTGEGTRRPCSARGVPPPRLQRSVAMPKAPAARLTFERAREIGDEPHDAFVHFDRRIRRLECFLDRLLDVVWQSLFFRRTCAHFVFSFLFVL